MNEKMEAQKQKFLTEYLEGLEPFLNWQYYTGIVYMSKDIHDIFKGFRIKREVLIDESLDYSEFKLYCPAETIYDVCTLRVFIPQFSKEEYEVLDILTSTGKAAFNGMDKKFRDKYPNIEALYPQLIAKIAANTII
jgi:hypothetical protein